MQPAQPIVELLGADIPRADVPGSLTALEDVNWRIDAGSFWAVGAFAGTGKTDLLCTTAGLQRPVRGRHLVFGTDTANLNEEERVRNRLRLAMIFSSGRLFSDLTLAENIALPLRYHHEGKEDEIAARVDAALERTGLLDLRNKIPAQLPRSLHQRAALARSLVLRPEAVLIDNPLLGLEPKQTRWWLDFLCELNTAAPGRSGITVVVAIDDFRPWIDTAREFAVLKNKRFELSGNREQVKTSDDPTVRELLEQT